MAVNDELKIAPVVLKLRIENNNEHLHGKKRAIEAIKRYVLAPCQATHVPSGEYEMRIPYYTDEGLDKIMEDLLREIFQEAERGNCFSQSEARLEGTDRSW